MRSKLTSIHFEWALNLFRHFLRVGLHDIIMCAFSSFLQVFYLEV